uniref:Uncharacterized protein n=1 Tax=Strigamia maritima TaxID=126957 RepID=T1J3H4_STRMM
MPFVHWVVEPKYVSRKELDKTTENEFESVSNNTLVAVLQQLACVVKCANRIFDQVGNDLNNIHNRSVNLTSRIRKLNETVSNLDAKKVPIPVGDLTKFSLVKEHYVASQPAENKLFLRENRPLSVQLWYDAASVSPVHIMRQIDKFREDGCRTSKYFICVPVFKDNHLEIETRRPASMCGVRKWQNEDDDGITDISSLDRQSSDEIDTSLLRLPSPEERTHAHSLKFPYSDVPIDVTGNSFRRMGSLRRSFLQEEEKKKSKSNRRNTISGGDEIEAALNDYDKKGESSSSMSKLRKRFSIAEGARFFKENGFEHLYSSLRRPAENKSVSVQTGEDECEDITIVKNRLYETLNPKKQSAKEEKKNKNKSNIPISTYSQAMTLAVKLRGNSTRTGAKGEDSGQSSSGNWSASSSTRTSVESENLKAAAGALGLMRTSSQASLSKDSALSEGTAQNELNDYQSDNSISTNASLKNCPINSGKNFSVKDTEHWLRGLREEVPSEDGTSTTGTLTPLLGNRTFSPLTFIDDEDSSVYSVDTDGYYTSMHTDSGLRSLSSSSKPADGIDKEASDETENGSTMSSISTIDQTDSGETNSPDRKLKKIPPMPPKRLSSLRCSSTTSSTSETTRPSQSPSPESDNSWKKKTVINASRIPSMCIVTPNPSDDEVSLENSSDDTRRSSLKNSSSGELSEKQTEKPDKRSSFTAHTEKKVSWSEGSSTLPRSFGRSYSGGPFSTHSWPRTPASHLTGKTSLSTTELRNKKDGTAPRLPLKYVQHITVTPGKRENTNGYAPIQSSVVETNGNRAQETPKIIYATNSLERKKSLPLYDRPKAHVALDVQGRIIPVNRAETPTNLKSPTENSIYQKPIYPSKSTLESTNRNKTRNTENAKLPEVFRYNCNTLPRARVSENGPPVPLFPSGKTQDAFRPNTFQYSSLPRKMSAPDIGRSTTPQRGPTPPGPEDDSSPRESMADLPPPMSLISPTLSQTARRWSYASSHQTIPNLRMQNDETRSLQGRVGDCRPSYLPIPRTNVSNSNRPPTPMYRPPPPPNSRTCYSAPPPIYQLVPRNQSSQMDQRPLANGKVVSTAPTNGPPTPQRHYVLNVPRGVQAGTDLSQSREEEINRRNGGMTNGQFYSTLTSPKSPITPENVRNGYCKTLPANYTNGDRYLEVKSARVYQQPVDSLKRSPKPSMSTDDLFNAIHQSKKRLNLKTELDRSASPSSVRSESPSLFGGRSQIPRVSSPESGTLSPRCNSPGGRKSWSGDCPSPNGKNGCNSPGDRKSWAMDRLGVNKPTTMRDFKMLLLHASRNTSPQNVQQRKSASEMLKVTPTKSPQPSPKPVYTKPTTPQKSTPLNGHLGIPIIDATTPPQRVSLRPINPNLYGRNRSRYPFHPHTDILSSPIWEDNMEDVDSPGSEENDFYYPKSSANGYGINTAKRALY